MYILKNGQLPDLIHDYVILEVYLAPQDGFSVSKISKFGVALKNWSKNMYHMCILKNYQLPDLIHDHVDLDVHLDPQDGLERLRNHKIRIPHEKLG